MGKLLKYIYNKIKFRRIIKFSFSVDISSDSEAEGMNCIGKHSHFAGYLGYGSYIGPNSDIIAKVGKYTSIAPRVIINPGRHPITAPFVTSCPAFFSTRKQNSSTFADKDYFDEITFADKEHKHAVIIGNDCWLGEGCFIIGGITIGNGAVVLAHAVVTKNIPPYAIVGGVPAKVLGYRYDEETISFLEKACWWDKEPKWLKENASLLRDIEAFKRFFKRESL